MRKQLEAFQLWLAAKQVEVPRWHILRLFGNSTLVQATVLVPILGYWILFSDYIYNLVKLQAPLSTSWKVYFLYYGLTILGLGSILYQWKCPGKIKRHATAVDFVQNEREFYEVHSDHLTHMLEEAVSRLSPLDRDRWELRGLVFGERPPNFTTHVPVARLTYLWHLQDLQDLVSRLWCTLIYVFGTGLVGIPALVTFYEISRSLFTAL